MLVFRRHGFRRSSIEQAAEAAGLTRQALYHHFKVQGSAVPRRHRTAARERACRRNRSDRRRRRRPAAASPISWSLRLRQARATGCVARRFTHVEELFSEHLLQARDLYQKYAQAYAEQLAATSRASAAAEPYAERRHGRRANWRAASRWRSMATKSAYPALQPADAFLRDLEIMLRTLVAGAVRPGRENFRQGNPPLANLEIADEHDDDQRQPCAPPRRSRCDCLSMSYGTRSISPAPKLVCGAGVCGACTCWSTACLPSVA